MYISEKIFEILKEKNITQKQFSKMTGIAESTISDWKRKKLNPSSDKLMIITNILGISVYELLGEDKVDYILDQDEKILIESYRNMDNEVKKRIQAYIKGFDKFKNEHDKYVDVNEYLSNDDNDEIISIENNDFNVDKSLTIAKDLTKRLRKLARLNRIKLDETEHQAGLNKHLFRYFDFIGIEKLEFVKEYLSHLQPFMISEIKSQEKFDNAICIIDEFYRISLYIKVDATIGEEIIVSFHENNKNGIAKRNAVNNRIGDVYVFADSIGSHIANTDTYSINLFITRGVKTFPISLAARKYDDEGFFVRFRDINNALVEMVNNYLEDIYTSDLDIENIESFTSLHQLSFTSYGNDVFSNISLLIDSLLVQKDILGKQTADAALCVYCNSINLLENDKKDLLDTLKQRFSVNSVRIMPDILNRVQSQIGMNLL